MEDYIKALKVKQEADYQKKSMIIKKFCILSEQQRNNYLKNNISFFDLSYSLSWFRQIPESNCLCYDNTLFLKCLLLRTTNYVRDSIYKKKDKKLISQFEKLYSLRQQIAVLWQNSDVKEEYIKNLEQEADLLDKALTQASPAFREFNEDFTLGWQNVQDNLQNNEAAIEFVSFKLHDKYDKKVTVTQYAALILRPNMKSPEWISLCEESELASVFKKTENEKDSQKITGIFYNEENYDLYNAIWKPLEKALDGVKTVYYSPSGLLHKISFNAIPAENGKRLIDIYNLNLVSSTRELAGRGAKKETMPKSAVVYGGIHYNLNPENASKNLLEGTQPPEELKKRGGKWDDLPYSDKESEDIHKELVKKGIGSILYARADGNKKTFKNTDRETGIIHLATHGFFIQDDKRTDGNNEWLERLGGGKRIYSNPLLRSGLALAGGNNWKEGEQVDGILLADEVANMNLTGAELVALSACETALGETDNSEGVFGLQRAFKLAGAQTLVMSLWQVEDKSTQMMMSSFYRSWLSGKNKQEAFKQAQKEIRSLYPDPYNWAAFVMID